MERVERPDREGEEEEKLGKGEWRKRKGGEELKSYGERRCQKDIWSEREREEEDLAAENNGERGTALTPRRSMLGSSWVQRKMIVGTSA
jgi:hypothetical protein